MMLMMMVVVACSTGDDEILQLRPKAKTDPDKALTAFNASAQTAESSGYVLCVCFVNAVPFLHYIYIAVRYNTTEFVW